MIVQPFAMIVFMTYVYHLVSWGPLAMLGHFVISIFLLRVTMNPVLKNTVRQEKAEADFRFAHVMARKQAESICISDGATVHRLDAERKFTRITLFQGRLARLISWNDGIRALISYTNSFWAYAIVITAARFSGITDPKELTKLVGKMSYLLFELFNKFGMISGLSSVLPRESSHAVRLIELLRRLEMTPTEQEEQQKMNQIVISSDFDIEELKMSEPEPVSIVFKDVEIVSPSNQLLVYGLSLTILPGQNTIIMGPSGNN